MGNKVHPKMDRENRAKQFMPFDALKGFREVLAEKERVLVPKKELPEEQKAKLDYRLRQIRKGDMVTVEYFRDGEYVKVTGLVTKIDEVGRSLRLAELEIPFEDLFEMQALRETQKQ